MRVAVVYLAAMVAVETWHAAARVAVGAIHANAMLARLLVAMVDGFAVFAFKTRVANTAGDSVQMFVVATYKHRFAVAAEYRGRVHG